MKKLTVVLLVLAVMCSAVFAQSSNESASTYKLRATTNQAATSTCGKALTEFVRLVNERSNGRIVATANHGAELGNQSEQVAMTMMGDLELVLSAPGTGPGAYEGCEPLLLFEFPFLFKDNDQYRRVMAAVEDDVDAMVKPIGLTAMCGMSMGARDILTNVPVTCLADMQNLVMRGPNAVYISMFESLGAAGITMDWNEIYTAMGQKVMNGCEGSPSMLINSSLQDNGKNLAITNHIIACLYFFFNTEWLEGLPQDLRDIVVQCAKEAQAYQEKLDDEDQGAALKAMAEQGVIITEIKDIEEWKKACEPMTQEYLSKGQNWVDFYNKLTSVD
ncbi:MAG: TRAP transporter substrate-binding protein [Sphaerochaetaceae bacterium]|nr:TRAP transporter substrate-binding protein [Sphaerochaetaceae bacterium]